MAIGHADHATVEREGEFATRPEIAKPRARLAPESSYLPHSTCSVMARVSGSRRPNRSSSGLVTNMSESSTDYVPMPVVERSQQNKRLDVPSQAPCQRRNAQFDVGKLRSPPLKFRARRRKVQNDPKIGRVLVETGDKEAHACLVSGPILVTIDDHRSQSRLATSFDDRRRVVTRRQRCR